MPDDAKASAVNFSDESGKAKSLVSKMLAILFLLCSFALNAQTYYIAPTGNDAAGNGSSANPWKSLYKACNAVTNSGATIYINAGTYIESSQCVLANGVSLDGAGSSSAIIKSHLQGALDDRGSGILRLNSGSSASRISNITFDGDNLTGYVAISVIGRSNVEIHHCIVTNFYRQGILFDGGTQTGNKVHDNVITNSGGNPAGMDARGANLGVWNNTGMQIYNNTINQKFRTGSLNGTGVSIGIWVYGLQMFNNTILSFAHSTPEHPNFCFAVECWSSNKPGGAGSAALGGWGTHIYGNTFEGELDIAFGGDKTGYDYSYYVHDNIFGDGIADANPQVFKTALQFEGEHRYVTVSNNTFRKGLTLPIYFCDTEDTQNCQDIQIFNNTFEDVTFGYMGHNGMFAPAIDFGSHGRYGIVRNISILNNTFTANRQFGGSSISSCAIFLPTGNDCDNVYIKNNIFTGFLEAAIVAKSQMSGGTLNNLVLAKNIYYNNGNNNDLKNISFTPTNISNDHGIIANPLFVSTTNFHLQVTSPAIKVGENVGLATDRDGLAYANPPSIGAYENSGGAAVNTPPSIQNQTFQLNEKSINGTGVGTVMATDPNAGQTLTYTILSGNTNNAFAMNSTTGALSVATSAALSYTVTPSFALIARVQDNGTGTLTSQATVTVNLNNLNQPPVISNQAFQINENASNGSLVGNVVAIHPDTDQIVTYSILSGNTNNAFAFNSATGALSVANSAALAMNTVATASSVFQAATPPTSAVNNLGDGTLPLEIGMKFMSNADGFISGFRFYKGAGTQGLHIGNLWSISGVNLASATFTGESASGWQTVTLSSLVAVKANTVYVVSYFSQHGDFVKSDSYFTSDIVSGPLTALGWTAAQPNGIYTYSSTSAFPNNNAYIGSCNYWADVIFTSSTLSSSFALVLKAQDNGAGSLSSQSTATVTLIKGNKSPVISNQAFQLKENSANGSLAGSVVATDPDAGQILTYTILSGNTNNAFAINSATGALTVATSGALNFDITPSFALVVKVQDNGSGTLSSQATVIVSLVKVNKSPVAGNQIFTIPELASNGTRVGTFMATDPDLGQTLSFSIISGNTGNAFSLNATTGVITFTSPTALNFLNNSVYSLMIRATDNGTGNLYTDATATINVLQKLNQLPVITDQVFSVIENAPINSLVGNMVASDPDAGQLLTYTLLSGNTNGVFAINTSTGAITVANSAALLKSTLSTQYTVFQAITPPGTAVNNLGTGTLPLEVGMKFTSNIDGFVSGFRFYKGAGAQGIHIGNLWSIDGVNLASATFTGETASGWQTVTLNTPVAVKANTIYVVSYFSQHGDFVKNEPYFASDIVSGPLTALGLTATQGNGVYKYTGTSAFPNNNAYIGSSNYWADVIFSPATSSAFTLVIKVQDNGTSSLSSQATAKISLTKANMKPVVNNQLFSIPELASGGALVGNILATNPNAGQTLSFSIISGNTGNAFSLNAVTGAITLASPTALNFMLTPVYNLIIRATDNGTGHLYTDATSTINVLQKSNESPVIIDQTFSVSEIAPISTLVGNVEASDPNPGQLLTYSILSGNTNGVFAINAATGAITVANSNALLNSTLGAKYSVFQAITPPGTSTNSLGTGAAPLEVGMKFTTSVDGYISGFRFYKGAGAQGIHIGNLWSIKGVKLATATFGSETASGWQTVTLNTPVAVKANTIYVVSYFSQHGDFVKSDPYFTTAVVSGPLTALGWTTAQPNGVYKYTLTSAFPNSNAYIGSSNYWADVIFTSAVLSPSFTLVVKVQDNGTGKLSSQAAVKVNLIKVTTPQLTSAVIPVAVAAAALAGEISAKALTTSMNDFPKQEALGIHIFPNPVTNGQLNVKLDEGINEEFDLSIMDLSGKVLLQKHYGHENTLLLDVSAFPSSLYVIQIRSLNFRFTDKFVIR